jgi:branched-chain amino acid aminotransferase
LLLDAVRVPGITLLERALKPQDLERADQVFITSTTRDLLPAVAIEGLNIRNDGSVVDRLRKALEEIREEYVKRNAAPLIGQLR